MFRVFSRRILAASATTTEQAATVVAPNRVVETKIIKKCSIMSRARSFFSGAVFASAVGMYVITFQLQGLLDEVRSAVHDVSIRQQFLESKIAKADTTSHQ